MNHTANLDLELAQWRNERRQASLAGITVARRHCPATHRNPRRLTRGNRPH